jgi:acid phosphatase family membrane protein YuiD
MNQLLSNPALVYGLTCWLIAQTIKMLIEYIRERRINLRLLISSGGMPSAHAAFVCGMALSIALTEGVGSPLFALAVGVAAVVMYDAAGVRRAAGHQATVINQIVDELFQGHPISEEKLEVLLGHTPIQVFFGALLGLVVTGIGMALVWGGPRVGGR